MSFKTESQMTDYIDSFLNNSFKTNSINYYKEFTGLAGRPDYLLIQHDLGSKDLNYIVALELKLKNWSQALKQAYRYSTYSNESFVIMDSKYIHNALNNIDKFKKYNIGLASFDKDQHFIIYYYPEPSWPFSKYYLNIMIKKFKSIFEKPIEYNEIESNFISQNLKKYIVS